MASAHARVTDREVPVVAERDDARVAVVRQYADSLEDVPVCGSCRDPGAAPRAAVHPSGNPWLSKLVCANCGEPWMAIRVRPPYEFVSDDGAASR